ncbi:MAG: hypothetical protein CFE32_12940 [Alphaproteobacteria bacterium PA3]|nr:MAG: hypothetical protein CFE32_12940 [Alphaproteobacteria bacterium PA3]
MIDSSAYIDALAEAQSTTREDARVISLLEQACEEGDDRATYALAQCSRYGSFGYPLDTQKAHNLTKTLENSNIAEAIFNLARDYDIGHCVRADPKKAFALYMSAALLGDAESCAQVAQYFNRGEIVPLNRKIAKAWKARSKCDEKLIAPPYRRWLS